MRKVGIISAGQAGNNILLQTIEDEKELIMDLLDENYMFETAALNTTEFDMNKLQGKCENIIIYGGDGAGKNRKRGKQLLKASYQGIIDKLVDIFIDCDVILLEASTGGGSGSSSIALITDLLRSSFVKLKRDKTIDKLPVFIPLGILPSLSEDLTAQSNTIEAVHEIDSLKTAYMLLDNNVLHDSNIKDIYENINMTASQFARIIRGDYNSESTTLGNMDNRDFERLISTEGLMTINTVAGIKSTDLDKMSMGDIILKSIRSSFNVQLQKDKVIGKIGIIYNITESMLDKVKDSYPEIEKEIGTTPYKFKHVNIVEDESETSIITILTGLSAPESRISEIVDVIEEAKDSVKKREASKLSDAREEISWLADDDEDEEDFDVEDDEDIFEKY